MVLGANMEPHGGGMWQKVTSVETSYFKNFGNYLRFDVTVVSPPTKRVLPYSFSIMLFMPNYAPVTPLPGATVESEFKLELKLIAWESIDLVNEGSGYITIPYYSVKLRQRGALWALWFIYEVEISEGDARLYHSNFITKLPTLAPTSLLL